MVSRSSDPKLARLANMEWETRVGHPALAVGGVDEVGRGCLAGPVVAAAVVIPPLIDVERDPWLLEVTDSKKLSPETRERLSPLIERWVLSWAIGSADVEEIDRINIYHASHLAMLRAFEGLTCRPAHLLVDGNVVPKGILALGIPATAVVEGDFHCLSVAAASILAKVWRDRLMREMDSVYPGYGFASHKGYGTPQHREALENHGLCPIHRRSFAPVAARSERLAAKAAAENDADVVGE